MLTKRALSVILAITMLLACSLPAFAEDGGLQAPTANPIIVNQVQGGTITIAPAVSEALPLTPITISATPAEGYAFASWSVTGVVLADNTAAVSAFVMPENYVTITAVFVPLTNPVSVGVLPTGLGTAVAAPTVAAPGTTVTITATPASSYSVFEKWTGNVTFADPTATTTTFVMPNQPVMVYANFHSLYYEITPVTDGGGYITLDKTQYLPGEEVTVLAAPNEGFMFYSWKSDDVVFESYDTYKTKFIMPAKDITIGAVFALAQSQKKETVGVTFDTDGGTAFGTTFVEVGSCVETPRNVPVKDGYVFAGWYADSTCTLPFDFSIPLYSSTIIYAKWAQVNSTPSVTNSFADVNSGDWFYECVMTLAERNIISGMGNSTFAPKKNISRAQFATILANLANATLYNTSTPFADVPENEWYAKAVAWAYDNGIVNGKSATSFGPNDNVSRQDMAVMIVRYINNVAKVTVAESNVQSTFGDDASIGSYAKEAVYAMQRAGVINGKPGNVFDPKAYATRAEASKMIYVLLGLL
ncbi:MAG: S-layer homology domain-containing protein [Oscillospiraceae bacterium]|nr:S-layer homology domain-containing protein [Oscillospiraceae bacterium]MBQ4544385.1 S-layer homology domain-containing protein [Oscillospiraceae bacterium]